MDVIGQAESRNTLSVRAFYLSEWHISYLFFLSPYCMGVSYLNNCTVNDAGLRPSGAPRHSHFGPPPIVCNGIQNYNMHKVFYSQKRVKTDIILTNSPF
jgi:hypothetical protein